MIKCLTFFNTLVAELVAVIEQTKKFIIDNKYHGWGDPVTSARTLINPGVRFDIALVLVVKKGSRL